MSYCYKSLIQFNGTSFLCFCSLDFTEFVSSLIQMSSPTDTRLKQKLLRNLRFISPQQEKQSICGRILSKQGLKRNQETVFWISLTKNINNIEPIFAKTWFSLTEHKTTGLGISALTLFTENNKFFYFHAIRFELGIKKHLI